MKIAYLLGSLNRGGTETLMLDTLNQAVKENVPCLLVHRKTGSLYSAFQAIGVPLWTLPIRHSLDIRYVFRLRRLLQSEEVSIVHAQLTLDAFLAWFACLGTGIRIILSFHGYDFGHSWFSRFLMRFMLLRSDLLLFVSQHLRKYYVSSFSLVDSRNRLQVLYNGVDFQKLAWVNSANSRDELTIPSRSLLIGMVGNFVAGRDQHTICRFLNRLSEAGVDFHMLFVGAKNEARPELYQSCVTFCAENRLLDRVHFLGSRSDVPAILRELNAFVYASDHDTFGIAVIEAIAAGVPVFVNDWDVMCEITNNGEYVTLYQTKNELDLSAKFADFLVHPVTYRLKALHAQDAVRQQYSIERHFQQLTQHYQELLSA